MKHWDRDQVKAALVDAFECMQIVGGRVGPKQYGSAMPDYTHSEQEFFVLEREDLHETGGSHWKGRQADRVKELDRVQVSARRIARMEICLLGTKDRNGKHIPGWLGGFLGQRKGEFNCLSAHAIQSARWNLQGKSLDAKRLCKARNWNYYTYRSRRDRGAEIIAFQLNELGLESWF